MTPTTILQAVGALLVTAALLAWMAPFWILFRTRAAPAADAQRRRARGRAACSLVVAIVAGAAASPLSLSVHLLNVLAVAGALCAAFLLVRYAFGLEPRGAGIAIGLLGGAAWCLALLFALLVSVSHYIAPSWVDAGGGFHCRASSAGFLSTDEDFYLEVFQRSVFIDRLVYVTSVHQDGMGTAPPVPPGLHEPLARCRAALDR